MKTSLKSRRTNPRRKGLSQQPSEPRRMPLWRMRLIQVVLVIISLIIFGRLFQIQVLKHEKYEKHAYDQYVLQYVQKANRGLILDRNLKTLALNEPSYDLGFHKRYARDYEDISSKMAKVLDKSQNEILKMIRSNDNFLFVDRKIAEEAAFAIRTMNLPGVTVMESSKRHYPMREKLAQVLGFVDIDGKGLSGIEYEFNNHLQGTDGAGILQKDALGKIILPIQPAENYKNGDNLVLTIDHVIQTIIEEELADAVQKYKAKGGSIIVTNPQTGEILAMASHPGFDANRAYEYEADTWRIRCITDIYEPGSTFKIVTLMAALTNNTKKLDDIIFCENGEYKIYGETINDHEKHGWLTFKDVFRYSSNIGTAKIALEVGKENLYQAARSFGFGNTTGIQLPGEVAGILKKPTQWSRFSVPAISYGYEVAVTPLQMAMAYGAIANGGLLLKPFIVKEIRNVEGERVKTNNPEVTRRVMTEEMAATMRNILTEVVEDGTGTQAQIPDLSIAGKTGTARKKLEGKPGYSNSKYIGSFAGFYPAQQPRLLIYIMIDEPTTTHWGGYVAAPTFKNVLQRILNIYFPIPKPALASTESAPAVKPEIPDLTGKRVEDAIKILKEMNLDYEIHGDGAVVQKQDVGQDSKSSLIRLETSNVVSAEYAMMPDLVGLSMRKAVAQVSLHGLKARIFGSGQVVGQEPKAGTKIRVGAQCMIECRPVKSITMLLDNEGE